MKEKKKMYLKKKQHFIALKNILKNFLSFIGEEREKKSIIFI